MIDKIIQFKSDLIEPEFDIIDGRLKAIIYCLAGFVSYNFGKSLIITELLRTQEMQDAYYKDNPDYQKKKWVSTHQVSRACDISVKYFTPEEINAIYIYINSHFVYNNKLKVMLTHDVGFGIHCHLQVPSSEEMILKNS